MGGKGSGRKKKIKFSDELQMHTRFGLREGNRSDAGMNDNAKLIAVLCVMAFLCGAVLMAAVYSIPQTKIPLITTRENLDNLKADAYTQGHIDGRTSVYNETYGTPHDSMGVPEGYISDRTPEWREYADLISGRRAVTDRVYSVYGESGITKSVMDFSVAPIESGATIEDILRPAHNLTFHKLRESVGMNCTQNETGHDPSDLVMHIYCKEEP